MAKATEFCIGLDNKPGTLAKLYGVLKRAKVNIDAVSVSENAECCWVRMVASPSATAKRILGKAKYHYCVQPVLTLAAHNRPGELERVEAMPRQEVQKIGFEIAILGQTGLDTNDSTQKYTLRSLPGRFSGLHLMSIMYVAFKIIVPDHDVGFDLSREYQAALALHKKQ